MSTPMQDLRAAAAKLRETAAAPDCVGTWKRDHEGVYDVDTDEHIAYCEGKGIAAWIALMSPDKAETLAAWLEDVAGELTMAALAVTKWPDGETRDPADYIDEPNSARHALAFARLILGRQS